jgi:heme-degrading monooxygenase HmoA
MRRSLLQEVHIDYRLSEKEKNSMTRITTDKNLVTHINVFTVSPENQQQLVDLLVEAAQSTIRKFPGYISSNYHKSLDGTKVTTYAQWRSQADFEAMLQSPEVGEQLRGLSQLATSFEPHFYEVVFVDEAVAE